MGRGVAQIFGFVSPQMHDEFGMQCVVKALEPFGLIYYSCSERLDKIHLQKKIRNLRKISISPWSDDNAAAEAIGSEVVMSVKPSSANAGSSFSEEHVRK